MKHVTKSKNLLMAILFFTGSAAIAQTTTDNSNTKNENQMKTYVIEREIPGAADLSGAELKTIAQTSCSAITDLGPGIVWLQSYVAGDKFYCIYQAESADIIKEHARKGGFPANKIVEVANIISPATATAN
jgi:hypothetical protein